MQRARADRVSGWAAACCAWALLAAAGCRGGWRTPAAPLAAHDENPAWQKAGRNEGVVPASFEDTPAQGTSILGLDDEEPDDSAWDTTLKKLDPKKMAAGVKRAVGLGPNESIAQSQYEQGQTLFRQSDYGEAASHFKKAAARWPDSLLEEDALFMLGECYFFSDRYPKASDAYANLLKKYENSRHLDKTVSRQFAIARYWEESARAKRSPWPNMTDRSRPYFDTRGNAVAIYKSITLNDPTGPLADDATMAAGNAFFQRGRWEDAAYHYDLLRKNYPQSDHQGQAHVLAIRAKLNSYQGTEYDAKPLEEAEELIRQSLVQFPVQLAAERERLIETQRAVRFERAQRDYQAGEYYYKQKYYRAARYYYAAVLENYADTPLAELAGQRMRETEDLPGEPPNHFRWLANLFPESRKL